MKLTFFAGLCLIAASSAAEQVAMAPAVAPTEVQNALAEAPAGAPTIEMRRRAQHAAPSPMPPNGASVGTITVNGVPQPINGVEPDPVPQEATEPEGCLQGVNLRDPVLGKGKGGKGGKGDFLRAGVTGKGGKGGRRDRRQRQRGLQTGKGSSGKGGVLGSSLLRDDSLLPCPEPDATADRQPIVGKGGKGGKAGRRRM